MPKASVNKYCDFMLRECKIGFSGKGWKVHLKPRYARANQRTAKSALR